METASAFLAQADDGGGDVNLAGSWDDVYNSLTDALPSGFPALLTSIGVVILVAAFGKYLWDKRRGGGGGGQNNTLLWTMALAAVLAAPGAIFPIILTIVDAILNFFISLWEG